MKQVANYSIHVVFLKGSIDFLLKQSFIRFKLHYHKVPDTTNTSYVSCGCLEYMKKHTGMERVAFEKNVL